ncbi:MAG: efflux RND transporter periplasmic adaptor subunit [Verrucomicrobiota bacterium JB022]|nr:efflux RND transporter periplasmic adaptor subunit [Verrucomicrobiota bacterium JB022]
MKVKVVELQAEEIAREIRAAGYTAANRAVTIRAETPGQVQETPAAEGSRVEAGTVLARLSPEDRAARVARAEASLEQARLQYEASQRLAERSLTAESGVAQARATFRQAQQELEALQLDLGKTTVKAPFAGIFQERFVEVGDYVGVGDQVAQVLELDPIVVRGEVTELQINQVHEGESAAAVLPGGRRVQGEITYVSALANAQTRTFTVELTVPNSDLRIPAGQSAEIVIETDRVPAHRVSIAYVSIDDDGRFGVKYVDDEQRVRFVEADLVRSTPDAIWVTGLPDQIQLITSGQGFTKEGDLVEPEAENTAFLQ